MIFPSNNTAHLCCLTPSLLKRAHMWASVWTMLVAQKASMYGSLAVSAAWSEGRQVGAQHPWMWASTSDWIRQPQALSQSEAFSLSSIATAVWLVQVLQGEEQDTILWKSKAVFSLSQRPTELLLVHHFLFKSNKRKCMKEKKAHTNSFIHINITHEYPAPTHVMMMHIHLSILYEQVLFTRNTMFVTEPSILHYSRGQKEDFQTHHRGSVCVCMSFIIMLMPWVG